MSQKLCSCYQGGIFIYKFVYHHNITYLLLLRNNTVLCVLWTRESPEFGSNSSTTAPRPTQYHDAIRVFWPSSVLSIMRDCLLVGMGFYNLLIPMTLLRLFFSAIKAFSQKFGVTQRTQHRLYSHNTFFLLVLIPFF